MQSMSGLYCFVCLFVFRLRPPYQVEKESNWASEASPTLGCSIEISRDIYMYVYMYVGMSCMSN